MDANLKKLEYDKILENLSKYCITHMGKDYVKKLTPSNSYSKVQNMLNETYEAVNLSYRNSMPVFYEIADIDLEIKRLESNDALSCKSLINLKNILKLSNELKLYFSKDFLDEEEYKILSTLFSNLYSNKEIIEIIEKSIIDENKVDDKASTNLNSIRRNIKKIEQSIKDTLNSFIHSSKHSKYIQENIITIRNDRFVIPIKEEYRSQIKGFVHDISNAGSTLFIEPISIFEMNNELNKLKIDEEIEIEKILKSLSRLFIPYIEELRLDIELIGKLDFIFAKVKYSKELKGITPIISKDKKIDLKRARHPLINKEAVVPISIELGEKYSTLVITGPNTGGKTVTLKTVGLLCAMACSGLNIPAEENSKIYVFDKIFADIGDNQSILESLSTFSSHMLNIVEITKSATKESLILVDELGSGTDPIEGANIAISILDYFNNKKCLTIATTHYQELKEYALVNKNFENASVEFDIKTLMPTYRLLIGIPGKSNAFEISKNLGLEDIIINKAKSMMTNDQVNIEELLKKIYDNKKIIEEDKEKIEQKLKNVSDLEKKLIKESENIEIKEKEIINTAKIKARELLIESKEEADEIIRELHTIKDAGIKDAEKKRNQLNNKIKQQSVLLENKSNKDNSKTLTPKDVKKGREIFIKSLNKNGIIVSNLSKSNEVQVQIGSIKMSVNLNDLERINIDKEKQKNNIDMTKYTSISKSKTVKSEINVIGLNVEEAIFVVDKFLDDCSLAKIQTARIIHGKGTGKLKEGIHKFLRTNPHTKSFRMGTYGEGEMGVTVVELK